MVENYIGGRKTPIPPEMTAGSIGNYNSVYNGNGNKMPTSTATITVAAGMGISGAGSTVRDSNEDEEWDEEGICDSLRKLEEMHNKVCYGFKHHPLHVSSPLISLTYSPESGRNKKQGSYTSARLGKY